MRLKGQKLHDTTTLTRQKKRLKTLEERMQWSEAHVLELQRKLKETASSADAGNAVVDALKSRIRELEAVEFVMTDRASRLAEQVKPSQAEVSRLTGQRSLQDKELARALRKIEVLKTTAQQKDSAMRYAPTRSASYWAMVLRGVAPDVQHLSAAVLHRKQVL